MPYDIDHAEAPPIVTITLTDPLSDQELADLREALKPLAYDDVPQYVIADLRQFDFVSSFQRVLLATDGLPLPSLSGSKANSRLAIVGGGPAISMIFKLMQRLQDAPEDLVRVFKTPDKARRWLEDQTVREPDQ